MLSSFLLSYLFYNIICEKKILISKERGENMFSKLNEYAVEFLNNNAPNIKIVRKNKIIYPVNEKIDENVFNRIIVPAENTKEHFLSLTYDMLEKEFIQLLKNDISRLNYSYFNLFICFKYYSFWLPNDDIMYIEIEDNKNDDYSDYLLMKCTYLDFCPFIKKNRSIIFLMLRK